MKTAYVLIAEYSDHSGFIVLRAYDENSKETAENDLSMLKKADVGGNMIYKIYSCEFTATK